MIIIYKIVEINQEFYFYLLYTIILVIIILYIQIIKKFGIDINNYFG